MRVSLRYVSVAGAILCLAAFAASAALARSGRAMRTHATPLTRPLRTALVDPTSFGGGDQKAFDMAHAAGASYVRLLVRWNTIAPASRPDGFAAADPGSPGYSWDALDANVSAAETAGLSPILDITAPPGWAYARRPHGTFAGTPSIKALGRFATALATHYDGAHGAPDVNAYEVWNEPNLSLYLYPLRAATYRAMVNAVASSVHAVSESNVVVAGGLDPFKNSAKRFRAVAPLAYMRSLLCLSKGPQPHATCKARVDFDVWSHHPYTFGGPYGKARLRDDVSLGDLPKMRALLNAAVRLHRVVHVHPVEFWVTEFGWDSSPPRPHAAPMPLAARWTAESLYQMWRSGVSLATWYLLQDRPSPSPYQSGLYRGGKPLAHARAKPVLTAFRFPFVAYLHGARVFVWGRDATSGRRLVTIQRRHGKHGAWRAVARLRANRVGIFEAKLRLKAARTDWLRAVARGSGRSLAFSLTKPRDPRYGPWGN